MKSKRKFIGVYEGGYHNVPKENEILIRVKNASIQTGDCSVRDLINTAKKEV